MAEDNALTRRGYYVQDEGGERPKIEVIVNVQGRRFAQVELDAEGLVAVVAKPDDPGFWVEVVKPGGPRLTEDSSPEVMKAQELLGWQQKALESD